MKFYSEKTKKYYDKADDCVADEAKFDKELAKKEEAAALAKAEKEKAVALRKEEAKKIEKENALLTTPKIPATGFTPFFTISFPFAFTYIR